MARAISQLAIAVACSACAAPVNGRRPLRDTTHQHERQLLANLLLTPTPASLASAVSRHHLQYTALESTHPVRVRSCSLIKMKELGAANAANPRGLSASNLVASSAFLAAIMSMEAGRLATNGVPTCVTAAAAGLVASSMCALSSGVERRSDTSPSKTLLALQSLLGGLLPHLAFFSISASGLAVANTLMFTMPLWTAIFTFLATGVPLGRRDTALSFISMLGVILVAWPGSSTLPFSAFGVAAGLGFGACGGGLNTLVSSTALRETSPQKLTALQMATTTLVAIPQILLNSVPFSRLGGLLTFARLGAVGGLMTAQATMRTLGLQRAKSAAISVLLYTEIAWCFILDVFFVGARPSLAQVLGAALIMGSAATSAMMSGHDK